MSRTAAGAQDLGGGVVTADIKSNFFKIANDLNQDGKVHYVKQLAKKGDTTSTVLAPKDARTQAFHDVNKMQKKAYRSN